MMTIENKNGAKEFTEKERKLISLIRSTMCQEIRIVVRYGQPVRIEEVSRGIKL